MTSPKLISRKSKRPASPTARIDRARVIRISATQQARAQRADAARRDQALQEAVRWQILRQLLDYDSFGEKASWERLLIFLVDWQEDRCRCPGAEVRPELRALALGEHEPNCNRPRPEKMALRRARPGISCVGLCKTCDDPPKDLLFESALCAIRPGAIHPLTGCDGCVYSYLGELEPDKSMEAAYSGGEQIIRWHKFERARRMIEQAKRRAGR